jgi:hypothetical protein
MLQSEFNELTGKKINYSDYRAVEIIYMYHPDYERKTKQEVALDYSEGKLNFYSLLNHESCKPYIEDIVESKEDEFSYYDVTVLGYVRNVVPKSLVKVTDNFITPELKKAGIDLDEYDYFQVSSSTRNASWPIDTRIACFAVTGGSEGHYIHVESMSDGKCNCLILGKTFNGFDHALKLSNALSIILS